MDKSTEKLRKALRKDFHKLYVKEYSIGWKDNRLIRDIEIGIMRLDNVERLVENEKKKSYQKGKEDLKEAVRERAKAFMMNGHGDFWEMLLRLIGDIKTEEDCDKAIEDAAK